MAYMGSPPGSLWQNVRNINDQRILANIRGLYGKHFPIEIRDQLAEWIESQRWNELDPSILIHQQEAQQLYGDMLTQLRSIKDHMRDFTEKMKWEDILEKLQANFDSNPFNLVEQMQSILKTERQFLKEYQGANMSPQPSPAASHHSTNSPDPSKLVHSPPGSQLTGNSHEAIGQSIQKICVMTHEAEGLLKSLEHQQEYFIIHINESHKLQAMVTHHSQQPVNPQVVQALRLKLQETEIALNKEVEALQQNRISITQQFHMLLGDLASIIHSVVNDELVGWKRIQNQALGLDTSPPADDLLVVLQGWFETLAELLWRNKQFIKQYYRLKSQLPMNGTEIPEDYNQTVDNLIVFLLRNSFVVEKQPPQVLKTNTRFSSTVRLMVGGKLNIHMNPPEVIATIISEKQAKSLAANPDTLHRASDISCGQMLNNKRAMEYNPTSQILSATFSNMSVKNIKRLEKKGSETVTDEKCAILLRSNIILPGSDVYFHVSTISLPVAVVVHGSQLSSAEGTMFWDKAFSDVNREPFVVPVQVPWLMLAKALNAYFFNTTGGSLPEICIDYLWKKIPNVNTEENGNSIITWQSFNKENLHVAPGKRREPFTFFDWFYGICELLKKHLSGFWKESLIFGFMGKLQAQEILINQRVGTFLLRFSETETGGISVAWVTQDANGDKKVWFLSPWFVKDLQIRPFADRLRDLTELSHVYSTHGQCYEKHAAFTKYYSPPTEDTNKGPLDYVTAQMKITLNTSDKLGDKGNNAPGEYTDLRGQIPMRSTSDSRSSINSPQNIPSNISTFSSNNSPSSTNMPPIHHQQHPLLRDLPTNLVYSDEIMPDEFDADEVDMILSGHMTHNF